jgi:hypothetical protein
MRWLVGLVAGMAALWATGAGAAVVQVTPTSLFVEWAHIYPTPHAPPITVAWRVFGNFLLPADTTITSPSGSVPVQINFGPIPVLQPLRGDYVINYFQMRVEAAGLFGGSGKFHPAPWSAVRYDAVAKHFQVEMTKNKFKASPSYDREQFASRDYGWDEQATRYFTSTQS